MNHRHRKVLHQLFQHPIAGNVHFKDVEAVLGELGGELSNHGAGVGVKLNGHSAVFSRPHGDLPADEIMKLRHFLQTCDVDPARDYPLS